MLVRQTLQYRPGEGLHLAQPKTARSRRTIPLRNVVRAARLDGIAINPDNVGPVTNTRLDRNVVLRAGDDGVDVDSTSTTLTRNVAVHNGDLGIEAVSGVTDGGGNRASGHGNPLQCTNISCQSGPATRWV